MLKRKKDGSFQSINSESDAALARERIDTITHEVIIKAKRVGIPALFEEQAALRLVVDEYVLDNTELVTESWQGTRVQAHTRTWNVQALRERLAPALFKRVITIKVDNAAVDGLVREGKVKLEDIEDALDEKPNKPYVKWTPKGKDVQEAGEAEAAKLAGLLS